ncbi:NTF2-related export protein 2 [Galendromus occidentalis]|uniref:NTF2-related export protein n=1 Tax=Galendromus occidentalis TaxID=34638 RepID=A0AAJ6QUK8_9ACAR|nr:NTF2-related export protein 2 [Galendromus occidentalis]
MSQKDPVATASKAGLEFAKIFYKTLDSKRHMLGNIYQDDAQLLWNGNQYSGKEAIHKFYTSLPHSETTLVSVDAQPITAQFQEGKPTALITCTGNIRLKGLQSAGFTENFVVLSEGTSWKVLRGNFRFHEPAP